MPCYSVVTNTVELENVGDHDLLEKSLKEQFGRVYRDGATFQFQTKGGYSVVLRNGKAESQMPTRDLTTLVGEIKQGYSRATVQSAVARFGWRIKPGKDANHFTVVKT
jgi:hypothetical protein